MEMFFVVMTAFATFMIGIILGASAVESQVDSLLNLEVKQVQEMQQDCEENLPRNIHCVPVLKFVPEDYRETIEN